MCQIFHHQIILFVHFFIDTAVPQLHHAPHNPTLPLPPHVVHQCPQSPIMGTGYYVNLFEILSSVEMQLAPIDMAVIRHAVSMLGGQLPHYPCWVILCYHSSVVP